MLKLAPIGQEASLCLRCQYRLSSRRGGGRATLKRSSTTSQQRQRFSHGRSLGQEQPLLDEVSPSDDGSSTLVREVTTSAARWYRPSTETTHGGERHVFPGAKDRIGFKALGKPAEVLILGDKELLWDIVVHREMKKTKFQARDIVEISRPTVKTLSSSDLLDEINTERGLINVDQVYDHINNIKAGWLPQLGDTPIVLTAPEYERLASQLLNGFTARQLAMYLDRADTNRPKDPLDLRNAFSSTLYTRSAWAPETKSLQQSRAPKFEKSEVNEGSAADVTHDKSDRLLSQKPVLVDRILRQCWQVKVKHDESVEGELHIRLHLAHLNLIMNHKRGILKRMSESYGAQIEASRRHSTICIISDYDNCLDVLKVIAFVLDNIYTAEIDIPVHLKKHLKSAPNTELDNAMLRQVEQLTNTVIQNRSTASWFRKLHIYYLGPDDADLQDARRLINQVVRPKSADKGWLVWCGALGPHQTIPAPVDVGKGLASMYRNQQWSRWCSPDIRETDHNKTSSGSTPLNTLPSPLNYDQAAANSLTRFFAPPEEQTESMEETNRYWQPNKVHLDSATLGQVLFSTTAAEQNAANSQTKTKGSKDTQLRGKLGRWRREFVTHVPGMVRLLEPLGAVTYEPHLGNEEFIHIRLMPSFSNRSLSMALEVLPDLEIRIALDDQTKTTRIEYVRLIHSKQLDFLLPQNSIDLRFTRAACVYWVQENNVDPRLQQFIENSNLDVWGTERLKTPTDLTLEIPPHALRPCKPLDKKYKKPEPLLADYTFASLEYHSQLQFQFSDRGSWTDLQYTSIEAGRIGGRRDEITLRQREGPAPKTTALTDNEDPITAGLSTICDKSNSASLLGRANALINIVENRPEFDDSDGISGIFAYRVEKERYSKMRRHKNNVIAEGVKKVEKTPLRKVVSEPSQRLT